MQCSGEAVKILCANALARAANNVFIFDTAQMPLCSLYCWSMQVLVLGNSSSWGGELTISHAVMADAIDSEAVRQAMQGAGIRVARGQPDPLEWPQVVAVLAKAEASSNGLVRGRRHTMLDDSDITVGAVAQFLAVLIAIQSPIAWLSTAELCSDS